AGILGVAELEPGFVIVPPQLDRAAEGGGGFVVVSGALAGAPQIAPSVREGLVRLDGPLPRGDRAVQVARGEAGYAVLEVEDRVRGAIVVTRRCRRRRARELHTARAATVSAASGRVATRRGPVSHGW